MNNTITAKQGYRVCTLKEGTDLYELASFNFDETDMKNVKVVADGTSLVMFALLVPYKDYLEEREENECFNLCEVFTTRKGNQYVYWRDEEIDLDCITKISR